MALKRYSQVIGVKPELRDEYLRLHAAVWPGVEATLSANNYTNYTIFILGDLLIAYFEYTGEDFEADFARISADPVTQEWWALTAPCQTSIDDTDPGGGWATAIEVWHLD